MTVDRAKRRLRVAGVYTGLVLVPVAVVIALLAAAGGNGGSGTSSSAANGITEHPLARLLLAVAVVVAVCKAAGALVRRIGQPPVIGEIAAGIVLGPSVLGAVWPAGASALIPDRVLPELHALAQLGVVLFVFLTGLELNTRLLRGRGHLAVVVSHVSIAVPFLLGVLLAIAAYTRFAPQGSGLLAFALFLGVSMSVTALPVLARILTDLGLLHRELGVVAMTCALVGDVTAWLLLAMVIALATTSSLAGALVTIVLTIAFIAVLLIVVRPLLTRALGRASAGGVRGAAPLALVAVLLCAMTTEWIGVHAILGAFLFGLVFPRGNPISEWLHDKVGGLTSALLLPLFFAYNGLRTEFGLLGTDPGMWLWCALILVVAIAGKLVGSAVAARAVGESWQRSAQLGALMNCRGLTELVVLNVGLDLGVLSPELFTMMVIMALVSTAMATPLVNLFSRFDSTDRPAPPARQPEPTVS